MADDVDGVEAAGDVVESSEDVSEVSTAKAPNLNLSLPSHSSKNDNLRELFNAIFHNDIPTAEAILVTHLSSVWWRSPEETPLTYACCLDLADMTLMILDVVGAHHEPEAREIVDQKNHKKWTPLLYAAKNGNLRLVKALFELGADVNALNFRNWSPLVYACLEGHLDVALYLIGNSEIDLHMQYHMPYHDTTYSLNVEDGGSDPKLGTPRGMTVLHCLAKYSRPPLHDIVAQMAAGILEKCPVIADWRAVNQQTALHVACRENNVALVRALLSYGVKVNLKDEVGRTAISYAFHEINGDTSSSGCLEMLMARSDIQVNIRDRYSFSPVHIATMYGDLQSVQLLAANGAQLDVRDHQQNLPVHYAARDQMVHILDFLLSQEPRSVNGVNWYDFSTPLLTLLSHSPHAIHRKAKPALIGCVRRLLRHGADTTIPNGYGKFAADLAIKHSNWDCVRLLLLSGSPFCGATFRQLIEEAVFEPTNSDDCAASKGVEEPQPRSPSLRDVEPFMAEDFLWCRNFALKEPVRLLHQARICIRRSLKDALYDADLIHALELPVLMNNFILMKEELV